MMNRRATTNDDDLERGVARACSTSEMTNIVSGGALNSTHPLTHCGARVTFDDGADDVEMAMEKRRATGTIQWRLYHRKSGAPPHSEGLELFSSEFQFGAWVDP